MKPLHLLLAASVIDDLLFDIQCFVQTEGVMARVDQSEAECVIREWADDLVNTDEGICSLISEAKATGVVVNAVELHSVWRGERGKPRFVATIIFKGEEYWPCALSDAIVAKVEGTFLEARGRLTIDEHRVEECDFDQTNALAATEYWNSK